jgi:hypothetical protein
MAYGDPFTQAFQFLSQTFNLPSSWFSFPNIIFYFIIPLIGLTTLYYMIINKKLRIFHSGGICFVIALIMAFLSSFLIGIFSPTLITALTFGAAVLFWGYGFGLKKIILAIAIVVIIFFFYPSLMSL